MAARDVDAGRAPDTLLCVRRGLMGRCPVCGDGRLFGRYLKVAPSCERCGAQFHHHRADDFPPYIVMFIVGHIVGYGIYMSEMNLDEIPVWVHGTVWPALVLGLSLLLLQPVKGAVVGLQYGLGMHGFAARHRADDTSHIKEDAVERRTRGGPEG